MMKKFSKSWIRSKQTKKQRKYRYNAPLHIKQKFVGVHLSKELRKKHGRRSIKVRKGDSIKILRDLKKTLVYISGIEITKRDGTKTRFPINPSNLMVTELNTDDKKRNKRVGRNKSGGSKS